ncbi:MAG: alpha/beta hydrolase [Pirellulales bacterium]|nr:alpha/beta hydrolase [Pirellulales bacterium]
MTINAKRRNWVFLACCVFLLPFVASASADRPSEDIWLLSTRCAPRCGPLQSAAENVRYWRLRDDCCLEEAEAGDFQADAAASIVVYVHGNGTESDEAAAKGMYVYRSIRRAAGDGTFRCVVWSWPAGKVCRRIKNDLLLKAQYCDVESYYLASWLDALPPETKVGLVGHSFGPRIIVGAAHLLAGGEVAGRRMSDETVAAWTAGKRGRLRAVLLAAAIDADRLAEGGGRESALSILEKTLVTRNPCDRVLRWYPRLCGRCGPQAMGFIGPCRVEDSAKVRVVDVSCSVGKPHDWRCYCSAPNVVAHWAEYAFLEENSTD